jgi:hypothetical protein
MEQTLLQLKIKLRKEKDINIMTKIQEKIDKKIDESRDRWWFKKKFFEHIEFTSDDESDDPIENELAKPRSMDRFLLDTTIINNYSSHIDKPYVINNQNKKIGKKR